MTKATGGYRYFNNENNYKREGHTKFWPDNLKGHLENVGVEKNIILKWVLREYGLRV
jgi:hypothetical protein